MATRRAPTKKNPSIAELYAVLSTNNNALEIVNYTEATADKQAKITVGIRMPDGSLVNTAQLTKDNSMPLKYSMQDPIERQKMFSDKTAVENKVSISHYKSSLSPETYQFFYLLDKLTKEKVVPFALEKDSDQNSKWNGGVRLTYSKKAKDASKRGQPLSDPAVSFTISLNTNNVPATLSTYCRLMDQARSTTANKLNLRTPTGEELNVNNIHTAFMAGTTVYGTFAFGSISLHNLGISQKFYINNGYVVSGDGTANHDDEDDEFLNNDAMPPIASTSTVVATPAPVATVSSNNFEPIDDDL